MTECAQCGHCCDPVFLTEKDYEKVRSGIAVDADWLNEHWKTIGPSNVPGFTKGYWLECDKYDRETKTCTAYDERPEVCSGYPFYDEDPKNQTWLDLQMGPVCSFIADVPGRILPIVEIT